MLQTEQLKEILRGPCGHQWESHPLDAALDGSYNESYRFFITDELDFTPLLFKQAQRWKTE
jgi:hypothetical protein